MNVYQLFIKGLNIGSLFFVLAISSLCSAQSVYDNNYLINFLEDDFLQCEDEENINWDQLLEELSNYKENPLNLNIATKEELEQFTFLSAIQIENILAYVYIKGQMQTIHELLLIEEMDKKSIDRLIPFVCALPIPNIPSSQWKYLLKYGKSEIISRIDIPLYQRKGYENTYLGPPVYHSVRYSYQSGNHLYAGIIGEKDAGEPFGALHNKKGYDFYGAWILLQNMGRLKTLSFGNYRLKFGQGLILNSGFMNGKSLTLQQKPFQNQGIYKHSSSDEYNYFRGVATTISLSNRISLSGFYSHRYVDGTLQSDTLISINKTGLHRTESEVQRKNNATLQMTGGNLHYKGNRFRIGITGIYYFLNRTYYPLSSDYTKYNINGKQFYNIGIDYALRLPKLSFEGEFAKSSQGMASLNKVQYSLTQNLQAMLLHRYYAHNYWSLYGHAFSEGSRIQNENGWYAALECTELRNWRFFSSIDLFSFPWWRYRISKPSQGIDYTFLTEYSPKRTFNIRFIYRMKKKERDLTGSSGEIILPNWHHRFRLNLTYSPQSYISFRTMADYNQFYITGHLLNRGYQFTQRISCQLPFFPIQINGQISYFNSTDYDTRVYIPERGLLNTFYTPSFSGKGFRYSFLLRYDYKKYAMLILKIGETIYHDRDETGTGYELISSNHKTDIQMQLRLKF